MDIPDVPELLRIPDPAPRDENPVETADYLMTKLLQRQPGVLHAEFRDGAGRWFVQSWRESPHTEECVAESRSVGEFRAVLARVGAHYMGTQLYGGHTLRELTQHGRRFVCRFFMSNDNWSGYWIRVYARAA